MKIPSFTLGAIVVFACSTTAFAQTYNPGGRYPDPGPATMSDYSFSKRVCTSPWLTIALDDVYGPANWGDGLCATALYNGGLNGSYGTLVKAVYMYKSNSEANGFRIKRVASDPNMFVLFVSGQAVARLTSVSLSFQTSQPKTGQPSVDGGTIPGSLGAQYMPLPLATVGASKNLSKSKNIQIGSYFISY